MSKKLSIVLLGVFAIAISCALLKRSDKEHEFDPPIAPRSDERLDLKKIANDNFTDPDHVEDPIVPPKRGIDMGDLNTAECDDMILARAKEWGKDPKTLRLLIREDHGGVRIYRELGMFIIVGPDGEEVFIPDEI